MSLCDGGLYQTAVQCVIKIGDGNVYGFLINIINVVIVSKKLNCKLISKIIQGDVKNNTKIKIKAKYTKNAFKREVQDSYKKTEDSELFSSCVSERH